MIANPGSESCSMWIRKFRAGERPPLGIKDSASDGTARAEPELYWRQAVAHSHGLTSGAAGGFEGQQAVTRRRRCGTGSGHRRRSSKPGLQK